MDCSSRSPILHQLDSEVSVPLAIHGYRVDRAGGYRSIDEISNSKLVRQSLDTLLLVNPLPLPSSMQFRT
jgi:hypothetical protein